jgi:hypothetical protein
MNPRTAALLGACLTACTGSGKADDEPTDRDLQTTTETFAGDDDDDGRATTDSTLAGGSGDSGGSGRAGGTGSAYTSYPGDSGDWNYRYQYYYYYYYGNGGTGAYTTGYGHTGASDTGYPHTGGTGGYGGYTYYTYGTHTGRPLRHDGAVVQVDVPATDDERALAWASDARDEHVSVASFQRFARQLRQLGAPAALIDAAERAVAEEARHAAGALAIASRFAGEALELPEVELSPEGPADLVVLAAETFLDGCCNEMLSTARAIAQREAATDPRVIAHLDEVIADETGHAALAWATVRWALDVGGEPVRRRIEQLAAQLPRDEVVDRLVRPCAEALLAA